MKQLCVRCCEWLVNTLTECGVNIGNIDVLQIGSKYDYRLFKISPIKLYHDVPQCGYRVFFEDYKVFYATDTRTLEGISAKDYDLYLVLNSLVDPVSIFEPIYNDGSENIYVMDQVKDDKNTDEDDDEGNTTTPATIETLNISNLSTQKLSSSLKVNDFFTIKASSEKTVEIAENEKTNNIEKTSYLI